MADAAALATKTRMARYDGRLLEVLHSAGNNCYVLVDYDGSRLTVHRNRLTFVK